MRLGGVKARKTLCDALEATLQKPQQAPAGGTRARQGTGVGCKYEPARPHARGSVR